MPNVDSEKLEAEADAILREAGLVPPEPENPDGDTPGKDTDKTTPPAVDPPASDEDEDGDGAEAVATPSKDDETPPAPDKGKDTDDLDGLTLENAAERIRNAQARMTRATQEAAELRRETAKQTGRLKELDSEIEKLKANPPAPKKPDSDGKKPYASLEALQSDYPTIINPLIETVNALQEQINALGGQVNDVRTQVTTSEADKAKQAEQAKIDAHNKTITDAHPDAFSIVDTDEFQGWIDRKPIYGRVMKEGTADEVVEMLDAYKKAVGIENKRKKLDDAARQVATPVPRKVPTKTRQEQSTFTRAQIDAMSPHEFAEREEEIDAAMAAGRITD